jgi:exonuclease SbcD
MTIKIVHTADNHIGMRFSHIQNESAKEKMVAERILSLKRIVDFANEKKAHFLVVAGDLFDKLSVSSKDIKDTAAVLNKFDGEAVLVLPGNHDFYSEDQDSLWSKVSKFIDESKVLILTDYFPKKFLIEDTEVLFFPAACRSKHSSENMIGWVKDYKKTSASINIGIAHGNVEGLGLDDVDKYFNMTPAELKKAGLDFWLLGHIHVPYPSQSVTSNPGYFFSATHTPDGFAKKHSGHFWYIEVDDKKTVRGTLNSSDSFRFVTLDKTINSIGDFDALKTELDTFNKAKTALRISISGRLDKEQINECEKYLEKIKDEFLYFEKNGKIKLKIDKKYINEHFPNDSLPYKLLNELLDVKDDGMALQLCNELIETEKNAAKEN